MILSAAYTPSHRDTFVCTVGRVRAETHTQRSPYGTCLLFNNYRQAKFELFTASSEYRRLVDTQSPAMHSRLRPNVKTQKHTINRCHMAGTYS